MPKTTVYAALSDRGHRIGEHHQNATITDAAVDNIRELHEDYGLSYDQIVKEFCGRYKKSAIQKICRYERRAQTPARFKRVTVYE